MAQNLNYAIDIKYLKEMWESYEEKEYDTITLSNYSKYIAFDGMEYKSSFKNRYFSCNNFSAFKSLTSDETKFANLLMKKDTTGTLQGIYSTFSAEDRLLISTLYLEMMDYSSNNVRNVNNLTAYDAIMETKIIPAYKYAMILCEYENTNDIESVIKKFPMDEGEDIFWRYMYGTAPYLNNNRYKKLSNFIQNNCSSNNSRIAWFSYFGYELHYDSEGKLNYVRWYW